MDIMTPSYLFSCISLLLMGYNTRYLSLSKLIRELFEEDKISRKEINYDLILLFRKRLKYIKKLQLFSIYALISSVVSTFLILLNLKGYKVSFATALVLFMISLYYSLKEIITSAKQY